MNYVYLLRCADDTLYCGWTTNLQARLAAHNRGQGAKYTRSRLPVKLVYYEKYEDRHEAMSREWHIKQMSREEKQELIQNGSSGSGVKYSGLIVDHAGNSMLEKESVMGILWATFQVNDMEKSLSFYNGILGLPVRERFTAPQDGAEIVMLGEDGGALLELISRGTPDNPGQGISIGLPFTDLEAIGETLSSEGYAPTPIIAPLPGVRFRFINDPDGYQIQLVER